MNEDENFRKSIEEHIVSEIQPDINLSQAKGKLAEIVDKNAKTVKKFVTNKRKLSRLDKMISTKRRKYLIQIQSENNTREYKDRWNKDIVEAKISNLVESDTESKGLLEKQRRIRGITSTLEEIMKHNRLVSNTLREIIIALTSASKDRRYNDRQ